MSSNKDELPEKMSDEIIEDMLDAYSTFENNNSLNFVLFDPKKPLEVVKPNKNTLNIGHYDNLVINPDIQQFKAEDYDDEFLDPLEDLLEFTGGKKVVSDSETDRKSSITDIPDDLIREMLLIEEDETVDGPKKKGGLTLSNVTIEKNPNPDQYFQSKSIKPLTVNKLTLHYPGKSENPVGKTFTLKIDPQNVSKKQMGDYVVERRTDLNLIVTTIDPNAPPKQQQQQTMDVQNPYQQQQTFGLPNSFQQQQQSFGLPNSFQQQQQSFGLPNSFQQQQFGQQKNPYQQTAFNSQNYSFQQKSAFSPQNPLQNQSYFSQKPYTAPTSAFEQPPKSPSLDALTQPPKSPSLDTLSQPPKSPSLEVLSQPPKSPSLEVLSQSNELKNEKENLSVLASEEKGEKDQKEENPNQEEEQQNKEENAEKEMQTEEPKAEEDKTPEDISSFESPQQTEKSEEEKESDQKPAVETEKEEENKQMFGQPTKFVPFQSFDTRTSAFQSFAPPKTSAFQTTFEPPKTSAFQTTFEPPKTSAFQSTFEPPKTSAFQSTFEPPASFNSNPVVPLETNSAEEEVQNSDLEKVSDMPLSDSLHTQSEERHTESPPVEQKEFSNGILSESYSPRMESSSASSSSSKQGKNITINKDSGNVKSFNFDPAQEHKPLISQFDFQPVHQNPTYQIPNSISHVASNQSIFGNSNNNFNNLNFMQQNHQFNAFSQPEQEVSYFANQNNNNSFQRFQEPIKELELDKKKINNEETISHDFISIEEIAAQSNNSSTIFASSANEESKNNGITRKYDASKLPTFVEKNTDVVRRKKQSSKEKTEVVNKKKKKSEMNYVLIIVVLICAILAILLGIFAFFFMPSSL